MINKKIILTLLFVAALFVGFGLVNEAKAQTYYTSGTLVSKNVLTGSAVASIDYFGYNVSALPASTTIKVQFSQGSNWYNSAGTLGGWDTLSQGDFLDTPVAINLSALNWSGPYFYYKIQLETSTTSTPVLDEIRVHYTPGTFNPQRYTPGTIVSKNLLAGVGVASIDYFGYNVSSLPASTTIKVQFSQGSNWYNSSGTLGGWDTLSQGDFLATSVAINLSALNWSGPYFYSKIQFETTVSSQTGVLDEIRVHYTPGTFNPQRYTSSTLISKNLLAGLTVNTIDSFYTDSTLLSGTSLLVQFSQDSSNWYSAGGALGGTTAVTNGQAVISLFGLGWSGPNFYYKMTFNAGATQTPVLDEIRVNYNNQAPGTPTSLAQYKSDCLTPISPGAWTNEAQVCLRGSISDPDPGDLVKLQAEAVAGSFANAVTNEASSWCVSTCASAITVAGLVSGSQYKWQARAIDDDYGAASSWAQFNSGNIAFGIDTFAPTSVSISQITADSASSLTVTGSATDAASGLHSAPFWFNETFGAPGASSSADWQASTIFVDSGLSANTQYSYQVKARDALGIESSYSASSPRYTLANVPSNLSLTADSQSQITASWQANSNPSGTEYFAENTTFGANSGWITQTSWQSTGLSAGTSYTFRVKAKNGNNVETNWSGSVSQAAKSGGGMPPDWSMPPAPPAEGFSISINNGAQYTNSPIATLNLRGGPNTERMAISNNPDFTGIGSTGQIPYQSSYQWNLCQGKDSCLEGGYTVYVQFYAPWGTNSGVVSNKIIYQKEITIAKLPLAEVKPPAEKPKKPFIEEVPEILKPLVPEFLKPKPPKEVKPPEVPIEELVLKEASLVFQGKWQLLPPKPIREFVLAPLPKEIRKLTEKFPELGETFEEVGVGKITDVAKLKTVKLTLPGLTERVGLPAAKVEPGPEGEPSVPYGAGKFALPKAIPVAKLSPAIKQQLPTEIVFARTAGELIDFNIALTVSEKGEPQQKISTISGKPLQLVVKPDKPVKSVKGYVVFKSKKITQLEINELTSSRVKELKFVNPLTRELNNLEIPLQSLLGSLFFTLPSFAKSHEPAEIETRLILLEFEYTDPDGDGIYTAEIQAPVVEGEYEIITVMDFEDPELGQKEIRLITMVDPEGYIYEKDGDKETRIPGVIVSLYWLNPETKQYKLWPAKEYQQENPQTTDVRGTYSFLVPEGFYYLKVEAPGYPIYEGEPFQVKEGSGVHFNIELKTKYWWLKIVDWKTILLIVVILFLLYNFYRDRIRERLIKLRS